MLTLNSDSFPPFRRSGDANFQDPVLEVSDPSPLARPTVPVPVPVPAALDQPLLSVLPSLVANSQPSSARREQEDTQTAPLVSRSRGVTPISDNPPNNPLALHARVNHSNQAGFPISLANQPRAVHSMEPDQQQQQQQSSILFSSTATDAPETIESLDSSVHSTTNATTYSVNVPSRSRPTRLHVPPTSYWPPPPSQQQQQQQQQNIANTGNPYYSSQQQQPQSPQQPQQYMSQPMSPAIYYPGYHPQSTPPSGYNVNQGYISPPHTTVGPSMPVTSYAYAYPHVSDHNIHPYAYHGIGGVTPTPLPHYPEHDSQQMHPHGANLDMMTGYGAMVASTAPPFGYTIPAYAPTPTAVFTPQYAGGHSYQQYNLQQSQPYSIGYGPSHPAHRPPSLNLSQQQQQQQPSQQTQQASIQPGNPGMLPQVPPSPVGYPSVSQAPPSRVYSPVVTSPSPGIPLNTGFGAVGVASSGSGMFSLGPSVASSATLSIRGTMSGYGSSGSADNVNRSGSGSGSGSGQVESQGRRPSTLPADRFPSSTPLTWPTRQEPEHAQVSGKMDRSEKADRSEWVMWVGNVPGDATIEELRSFFSQSPELASESYMTTDEAEPKEQEDSRASSSDNNNNARISNEDKDGGVVSVFLISRSNCAFVNYTSEEALSRGVTRFNGKPLRSPQVDPRCPKLVCRVRKKGDDLKAGVGGQRGVGIHTRWVKEKTAAEAPNVEDAVDESKRPPLVRSGALVDGKKSSSGSSVSFVSTSSSLLTKHFPVRYFILKSLTQYDLDLSVQRGLWATQAHNEETLEQAYRTSKTVYLIFSVNKSGEFFGYAKMDGPIKQVDVERTPSIEWASRDATGGSSSARASPVNARGAPQPTIEEEQEGAEAEAALPVSKSDKPNLERENAADAPVEADPRRFESMPTQWVQRPGDHPEVNQLVQHASEPSHALHHLAVQERENEPGPLQISEPVPPKASPVNVMSSPHSSHLFASVLQESPDPLTPGEDRRLHHLENATPLTNKGDTQSSSSQSHPLRAPRHPAAGKVGHASAPAEMGPKHKELSVSTPSDPPETWDGRLGSTLSLWTPGHSIEEEEEGPGDDDLIEIPSSSRLLPLDPTLAISLQPGEGIPDSLTLAGVPPPTTTTDALHSDSIKSAARPIPGDGILAEQLLIPTDNDKAAVVGGREEGWGTPFKVKWVRTDPLPFHRTRHLRNPWNHDREVKVSRDGTEIESTVGQRLIDEWERTDPGLMSGRAGLPPRMPLSTTSPTAPTSIGSRGRGRGQAASGGQSHADINTLP